MLISGTGTRNAMTHWCVFLIDIDLVWDVRLVIDHSLERIAVQRCQ